MVVLSAVQARVMWRVDEWSAGVVAMMIADGMLPPYPKPGSQLFWNSVNRLARATAAPVTLMQMLLARRAK